MAVVSSCKRVRARRFCLSRTLSLYTRDSPRSTVGRATRQAVVETGAPTSQRDPADLLERAEQLLIGVTRRRCAAAVCA